MEFRSVSDLAEAVTVLGDLGDDARVLAGGTDVMIQHLRGEIAPRMLLHIERVAGLRGISGNGTTRLGPLTTHRMLATDVGVRRRHPALAEAAATVGGWQTQAVGTVGGNICNASPAADTAPPLLVADATVTLTGPTGDRVVPLAGFFVGRRSTVRRPDELVTALDLEPLAPRSGEVYLKVGRRAAMEVAVAGLAVRLALDDGGVVTAARVAMCSLAPTPRRVPEAEHILVGSILEDDALAAAGDAIEQAAEPIADARASAGYRRRILRPLLVRAAARCREHALS